MNESRIANSHNSNYDRYDMKELYDLDVYLTSCTSHSTQDSVHQSYPTESRTLRHMSPSSYQGGHNGVDDECLSPEFCSDPIRPIL